MNKRPCRIAIGQRRRGWKQARVFGVRPCIKVGAFAIYHSLLDRAHKIYLFRSGVPIGMALTSDKSANKLCRMLNRADDKIQRNLRSPVASRALLATWRSAANILAERHRLPRDLGIRAALQSLADKFTSAILGC